MLYLVPTPVGNLEDVTLRALRVLREVDLIACEDTRTSGVLLKRYDIGTPRTSYHEHNERSKAPKLVDEMLRGKSIALITDAGTPGISDPAFYLVRECVRHEIEVTALPGASAVLPALTVSGLPTERFVFEGFLPPKKGRRKRIEAISVEERTTVLYESPHRLTRTLMDLAETLGNERRAVVVRELSKKFEEIRRGTLEELASEFAGRDKIRGEIVLVVAGA